MLSVFHPVAVKKISDTRFVADRTLCIMNRLLPNGIILSSVRLSVTLCTVAPRFGVGVGSCTIWFLGRHFLFASSDTFAVLCIVNRVKS